MPGIGEPEAAPHGEYIRNLRGIRHEKAPVGRGWPNSSSGSWPAGLLQWDHLAFGPASTLPGQTAGHSLYERTLAGATRTDTYMSPQFAGIPSMNSPVVSRCAIGTYREQVSIDRFGRSEASTGGAKRKLFSGKHFDRGSEKVGRLKGASNNSPVMRTPCLRIVVLQLTTEN